MEKITQSIAKILKGNFSFKLLEKVNEFNIAKALLNFIIILLLSVTMVSAGDIIAKAGDFDIDGNLTVSGNITLGQKIIFALDEIIDNIIDGLITITGDLKISGDLNVTGDANISGNTTAKYYFGNGSFLIGVHNSTAEIVTIINAYPTGNTTAELTTFLNTNRTGGWSLFSNLITTYLNSTNINVTNINATYIQADYYFGDGSQLTNIPGGNASFNESHTNTLYLNFTSKNFNSTAEIAAVATAYPTGNTTAEIKTVSDANPTGNSTNEILAVHNANMNSTAEIQAVAGGTKDFNSTAEIAAVATAYPTGNTTAEIQNAQRNYFDQQLNTTNAVTFGNIHAGYIDTGQGNNDLYDMNQNVETTSTVSFN